MIAGRRGYLDWLRGLGALVMIQAHTYDAWTSVADRSRPAYGYLMILAGFAAPIFLFLAGLSLALAIGARVAKGASPSEAARLARRRGWQLLGLALVFRLQSWVLSGGAPWQTMLKVDILNIMGLAMVGAVVLWSLCLGRRARVMVLALGAAAVAMATPLVRATPYLAALPDPLESYLRPLAGRGTFALFPWVAFLFAGTAVGVVLDAARDARTERRVHLWLGAAGTAIALAAWFASFLPPIYPVTSFWTSSPTFLFLRVGLLLALVPLAYAWEWRPWSAQKARASLLYDFGRSSLFVYWVHVELAYGGISGPLHRQFSLEAMAVAYVVFCVLMFGLVRAKQRFTGGGQTAAPGRLALDRVGS